MKYRLRRSHVQPRWHRKARTFSVGLITVFLLATAGFLLIPEFRPVIPLPGQNTIYISANMGGFSQNVVHLNAGEPVTIRLTSLDHQYHTDGGGQHQWAVDELGLNLIAPPLGSNILTFTPDQPGTYTFYCDICCGGRASPTMQGTLIVEA